MKKRKKKLTWSERMHSQKEESKKYGIAQSFYVGDFIDHKNFGKGYIQNSYANKIEVLFEDKVRTLIHMVVF